MLHTKTATRDASEEFPFAFGQPHENLPIIKIPKHVNTFIAPVLRAAKHKLLCSTLIKYHILMLVNAGMLLSIIKDQIKKVRSKQANNNSAFICFRSPIDPRPKNMQNVTTFPRGNNSEHPPRPVTIRHILVTKIISKKD